MWRRGLENTQSETYFDRAKELIPGGVNSPVRAFGAVGGHPFFVERAQGPWLYDVDGNQYLDYVCSWGPGILGHAPQRVLDAVQRACGKGLTFGAPTPGEVELASKYKQHQAHPQHFPLSVLIKNKTLFSI